MKQTFKSLLFTLLACSLFASVGAAENNPVTTPLPSSPPSATQSVAVPLQKPVEVGAIQSATRLGHVDLARIAAESETGKTGQAKLADLKKKLQGQIEAKRKSLEKQQAAIQSKLKTFSPQQREAKAKEFQKKVEDFQRFGVNAEKELQAKQEEFSAKLFKAIEMASAELGKAKNLALVMIKREVLYLGSGVDAQDVTEDVIKKIDTQTSEK